MHKHSDECAKLMQAYLDCQVEHPIGRIFNYCAKLHDDAIKCLKKEREKVDAERAAHFKERDRLVREREEAARKVKRAVPPAPPDS